MRLLCFGLAVWLGTVCGQGITSPNVANPTGRAAAPSDPDSSQSLSTAETVALRDLYQALIKGSPAESVYHDDWSAWVAGTGTNPCGLKGTNYWVVEFLPYQESRYSWCSKVGSEKLLSVIDMDLIPAVAMQYSSKLFKDAGQVLYLSDEVYCHSRNWYAMIKKQKVATPGAYANMWRSQASGSGVSFAIVTPVAPPVECKISYAAKGILPSSLGALTRLTQLRIRMAGIAKQPIPTWIGGMTGLTALDLSFNSFTGSLPTQLFLLTNLEVIHLNDNFLTGSIPTLIGLLQKLQKLEIGYHAYDTSLFEAFGGVPLAGSNSLSGSIPTEICLLTNLKFLQLNNNGNLHGSLPSCLNQLTALKIFDVRFNSLSGKVPQFYSPPTAPAQGQTSCLPTWQYCLRVHPPLCQKTQLGF